MCRWYVLIYIYIQYNIFLDVRNLISVDDVLEDKELALGPNGALVFCMEYLTQNLEWLHDQLNEGEDDYFLFDCPGNIFKLSINLLQKNY